MKVFPMLSLKAIKWLLLFCTYIDVGLSLTFNSAMIEGVSVLGEAVSPICFEGKNPNVQSSSFLLE